MKTSLQRAQFFALGAALIALAVVAYVLDRPAFNIHFVFVGLCSISIGLLELRRENGSLRGKAERG